VGNCASKLVAGCCLGIETILLVVSAALVFGQKSTLKERKEILEELDKVNGCGDNYMYIPSSFVNEIRQADTKTLPNTGIAVAQAVIAFLCLGMMLALKPSRESEDKSFVQVTKVVVKKKDSDHSDHSDHSDKKEKTPEVVVVIQQEVKKEDSHHSDRSHHSDKSKKSSSSEHSKHSKHSD